MARSEQLNDPKNNTIISTSDNSFITSTAIIAANDGRNTSPSDNATCAHKGKAGDNCSSPDWLTVARSFEGLHEGGKGYIGQKGYTKEGESEAVLMFNKESEFEGIAKDNNFKTFDDGAAWCGSFVNWCLVQTKNPKKGENYPTIKSAYKAAAWEKYGKETKPCLGTILVIQSVFSDSKGPGGKHVTFVVGKRNKKIDDRYYERYEKAFKFQKIKIGSIIEEYLCLGGNQDDEVKFKYYGAAHRFVTFCIPEGYKPCDDDYKLDNNSYTNFYNDDDDNSAGKIR
ncbi:hypothetical protein [Bartonella sp. HY038]|uniref:hypothetical protein n=1 Tax=Bartonella sp. HY038 TaxID=2759660 RepID=UPI0015FB5D17|nr:hypothetical protein [Bartonella sp. HY038]